MKNNKIAIAVLLVAAVGVVYFSQKLKKDIGDLKQESGATMNTSSQVQTSPENSNDPVTDSENASSQQEETGDLKNIGAIAKVSLDEALVSYGNSVKRILSEQAQNSKHIQDLLQATLVLSEIDGANDHYFYLTDIYEKYPAQFKSALDSMSASSSSKEEILETVKSASRSKTEGNG